EPLGGGNLLLLRRHIRGTARVDERAVLIEGNLGGLPGIPPTAECYYYILQDLDTVAAEILWHRFATGDCSAGSPAPRLGVANQTTGWKPVPHVCEGMVYAGYGRATTIGWPRGDFNRDGHVTSADVAMFLAPGIPWSGPPTPDPAFDLDLDGDRDLWDRGLMQDGVSAAPERVSLVGNPFAFTGRRLMYYESEPDPNNGAGGPCDGGGGPNNGAGGPCDGGGGPNNGAGGPSDGGGGSNNGAGGPCDGGGCGSFCGGGIRSGFIGGAGMGGGGGAGVGIVPMGNRAAAPLVRPSAARGESPP
ncbi:MAG: hypothetical protein IT449_04685, partial [Phycisphaerales bacterium]|nr:hypothetical protein [Phycisphaerales bacterium]